MCKPYFWYCTRLIPQHGPPFPSPQLKLPQPGAGAAGLSPSARPQAPPYPPFPTPQPATPIVCLRLQPGGKEQGRHCSQIPASKERRIKGGGGGKRSKAGEGRGIRGLPATGEAEASDNRACLGKLGSGPRPHPEEPFL